MFANAFPCRRINTERLITNHGGRPPRRTTDGSHTALEEPSTPPSGAATAICQTNRSRLPSPAARRSASLMAKQSPSRRWRRSAIPAAPRPDAAAVRAVAGTRVADGGWRDPSPRPLYSLSERRAVGWEPGPTPSSPS